ncbi:MAG: DUF192 domain-containing protein [Solirubrobacteraceae bacterium]
MKSAPKPILNLTRDNTVCEQAIIADQPLRRMRGLLGQSSLPVGDGILLMPAPSVHTAFMRFAIDVIFIDRDFQVVKIAPDVAPWRMASARRARHALELPAGQAARRGVQVGDVMVIGERHEAHHQNGAHADVRS